MSSEYEYIKSKTAPTRKIDVKTPSLARETDTPRIAWEMEYFTLV